MLAHFSHLPAAPVSGALPSSRPQKGLFQDARLAWDANKDLVEIAIFTKYVEEPGDNVDI